MVTYSAWMTHDYQTTTGIRSGQGGTFGTLENGPWPDPYYSQGDIEATLTGVTEAPVAETGTYYILDLLLKQRTSIPLTFDRYYKATRGTSTDRLIQPTSLSDPNFNPELPPGATGWEWEAGIPPEILAADATFTYTAALMDETVSPPVEAAGGEAYLEVLAGGVAIASETIYRTYGSSSTITSSILPYVSPMSGALLVDVAIKHQLAPIPRNPYAVAKIQLTGGVIVSAAYSTRRRYRFIFGGETPPPVTQTPYNRIVQRGSDGLGMTGGRRVLGARSKQATNRRGAAFL